MSPSLKSNRWSVGKADFATRIIVPDLNGLFAKILPKGRKLVIEPGTRALVIDEGIVIGDVPPGEYTLESFFQRLDLWRNKQTTVFLTRSEDVPFENTFENLPCLEGVSINGAWRFTVQVNDVLPFMENLMGANEAVSLSQFQDLVSPLMNQAMRDVVGENSFDKIMESDFSRIAVSGVRSRVDAKLKRYGLLFHDVQSLECHNKDQVAFQKKKGELFIKSRETQLQEAVGKIKNDRLAGRLKEYQGKVPIREALRDTVTSDKVDKLQNVEDFKKAVSGIDKQRLLRKEEVDTLTEGFNERKEDREKLREHILATLDLQREQDLDSLRLDLDHEVRMSTLGKEIEIASLSRSGDADEWRAELERDKEEAQHRWQQKHERVKARWERIREERKQDREDSWEDVVHQEKMEGVEADLELNRAERARKLTILDAELNNRLAAEKLEIQKREKEWQLEVEDKQSINQMDRLQRVQEMNAKFAEQQQRLQTEMETLKADNSSKHEIDRIKSMANLSTEALIATSAGENAAMLTDLKKTEATAGTSAALDQERLKMYEKLNETERAKADAIAEAYKTAMQAQQGSVQQMIGGLSQASTPAPSVPPSMPHVAPPPMPTAEVWHVSFSGQQSPPLQMPQVQQYIQTGQVTAATMVWKTGMAGWVAAGQVPELAVYFSGGAAGPPSPPPA